MTNEQALQKYAVGHDAEAFRILVEQYQCLVYSVASRRLARIEDIEDVAQLTFLKLAKSAGTVRRNLSAWLYATAMNTAADLVPWRQPMKLPAMSRIVTSGTDLLLWSMKSSLNCPSSSRC